MFQRDTVIQELDALKMERDTLVVERGQFIKEIGALNLQGKQMAADNQLVRIATVLPKILHTNALQVRTDITVLKAELQRAQSSDTQSH